MTVIEGVSQSLNGREAEPARLASKSATDFRK